MSNRSPKERKKGSQSGKESIRRAKNRVWTTPTIIGLILAAVALVELRPQISVTPQGEIETNQPFSVPFSVANAGYLPLYVSSTKCFIKSAKAGGFYVHDAFVEDEKRDLKDAVLDASGGTVHCRLFSGGTPTSATIAIVVDYKYKMFRRQ
jgi:hypothetical protein